MSWDEVPDKLEEYANSEYAPNNADVILLSEHHAVTLDDITGDVERAAFEEALDYRLGACRNLATSKAVRPENLQG